MDRNVGYKQQKIPQVSKRRLPLHGRSFCRSRNNLLKLGTLPRQLLLDVTSIENGPGLVATRRFLVVIKLLYSLNEATSAERRVFTKIALLLLRDSKYIQFLCTLSHSSRVSWKQKEKKVASIRNDWTDLNWIFVRQKFIAFFASFHFKGVAKNCEFFEYFAKKI